MIEWATRQAGSFALTQYGVKATALQSRTCSDDASEFGSSLLCCFVDRLFKFLF
jgi:hypothetical protein